MGCEAPPRPRIAPWQATHRYVMVRLRIAASQLAKILGQRFESARRLSAIGVDKPDTRGRGHRGTAGEGLSTSPVHHREGAPSPVDWWRGTVLLVAYVLAPGDGAAPLVDLLHGYVGHEAVRGGAVPVLLARLEEHAVARADHLDPSAAALAEANALGDVDGLPEGVGVPRGSGARGEVDAARLQARGTRRHRDRVDVDRAGEPLARPRRGLDSVPGDLHDASSR